MVSKKKTRVVDDVVKNAPLKTKAYEQELRRLHVELVKLQQWVVAKGLKVCIVFEGRDGAGKGGAIKAITERVSPRVFRVVALPAPTDKEKSQLYFQRYVPHLPSAGEIVIFDRSWYNRAGVERVMGFCTEEQAEKFLDGTPVMEKAMVDAGIILLKYWLEVTPKSRSDACAIALMMVARSGSCLQWILNLSICGMNIPSPATRCLKRPTPPGRRGLWRAQKIKKGAAEYYFASAFADPL